MFNDETITIINRLKSTDSETKRDIYYKTVLNNCAWYTSSESTASGTNVSMGSKFKVMIPFSDNYLPYNEWKQPGMQDGNYTMSETDVIIKGEVTEDITSSNITTVKQSYEPFVCNVRVIDHKKNRSMKGIIYQLVCEGV